MTSPVAPIALAGAGSVAQALGHLLARRGHTVVAVASRSHAHAGRAAQFIGPGVAAVEYEDLGRMAVPTVIAVSDSAIGEVAGRIASASIRPSIVVHTCGAAGPGVLRPLSQTGWSCGVLHPLQTVPTREQGILTLVRAPFAIGGDPQAVEWSETLVAALEGRLLRVRPDAFALYHAAAVLAGNGAFALVEAAVQLMAEAGIPRGTALDALAPLCRSSLDNALAPDDGARLTGPVARGDSATIGTHLAALSRLEPEATSLYSSVTMWLVRIARRHGLSPELARRMDGLLARHLNGDGNGSDESSRS